MLQKKIGVLSCLAIGATILPGMAATPAQAAAGAYAVDIPGAPFRDTNGNCLKPQGRELKIAKCKPGYWHWRAEPVKTTLKGGLKHPVWLFKYGDPKAVSPGTTQWWCLDTDAKDRYFMSQCSTADRGQLFMQLGTKTFPTGLHTIVVSVKVMDDHPSSEPFVLELVAMNKQLTHNGSKPVAGGRESWWRWSK